MSEIRSSTELQLACRGVTKVLDSGGQPLTILDGIDLEIARGELISILGPSGSGKSTLLGLLAGLDRPTAGSVVLEGQALETLGEDELALLRRRRVGFVFQSFQLLGNLTARENVQVPMFEGPRRSSRERAKKADELLELVGMSRRAGHRSLQLSVGERQRVALARSLANDPALLLADEPTGNLDSENAEKVLDLLTSLQKTRNLALVVVTHSDEVAERADRVVKMRDGKVVADSGDRVPAADPAATG